MTACSQLGIDPMQADIEAHYRWIEGVAGRVHRRRRSSSPSRSSPAARRSSRTNPQQSRTSTAEGRRDPVHKVWGLLIFAAIMGALFVSIFWLAKPIMDGISTGIDWLGALDGPLAVRWPAQGR